MSQHESGGHEDAERRGYAVVAVLGVLLVLGLILLPFVPLVLSLIETTTTGTRHVEEFFEKVGLHDELSALYRAVFFFIK